jgi:hypothetical protein
MPYVVIQHATGVFSDIDLLDQASHAQEVIDMATDTDLMVMDGMTDHLIVTCTELGYEYKQEIMLVGSTWYVITWDNEGLTMNEMINNKENNQ